LQGKQNLTSTAVVSIAQLTKPLFHHHHHLPVYFAHRQPASLNAFVQADRAQLELFRSNACRATVIDIGGRVRHPAAHAVRTDACLTYQ